MKPKAKVAELNTRKIQPIQKVLKAEPPDPDANACTNKLVKIDDKLSDLHQTIHALEARLGLILLDNSDKEGSEVFAPASAGNSEFGRRLDSTYGVLDSANDRLVDLLGRIRL